MRDFVRLSKTYASAGKHHGGIIVSNHLPFGELLRRILILLLKHSTTPGLADQLLWLQDFKEPTL